jgi:hypothetical protein
MLLLTRSRRILRAVAITVGVLGFSAVVALLPKPVAAAFADAGVGVFPDHNGRGFVLEGRFFHDRGFGRGSIATPGFSRGSIATPGFARGSIATPRFARSGIGTSGFARGGIATSGFIRGGFAASGMMRGGGR